MIEDTIGKIEARIQAAEAIKDDRKQELLQLIATLKSEVVTLAKTHDEEAQSIARFTEMSAHEATRGQQNPQLLQLSLSGLTASVEDFEKSHPKLTHVANAISRALANLGI